MLYSKTIDLQQNTIIRSKTISLESVSRVRVGVLSVIE